MKKNVLISALCPIFGFSICLLFSEIIPQFINSSSDQIIVGAIPFWRIMMNNLLACIIFLLGCGILTALMLFIQGISFGCTYILWIATGNSPVVFCKLFVPHVIFEYIAMILSGVLGFELLYFLMQKKYKSITELININKKTFIWMILSVIVGAIVESYITPKLFLLL